MIFPKSISNAHVSDRVKLIQPNIAWPGPGCSRTPGGTRAAGTSPRPPFDPAGTFLPDSWGRCEVWAHSYGLQAHGYGLEVHFLNGL